MFSFLINIICFLFFEVIYLSEKTVVPGDFLTVEEEYSPGKNTFEDDEGNVYSTKVGTKEFDEKEREVSIKEKNPANDLIEFGSIVTGKVTLVKDSVVVLNVLKVEKDGKELISTFSVMQLMISKVSREHIRELRDAFKIGDFVKAKVIKISKFGVDLTTAYPEFGVIKAFCSKCRSPLSLFDRTLKCSKCGSIERRKLSSEFK